MRDDRGVKQEVLVGDSRRITSPQIGETVLTATDPAGGGPAAKRFGYLAAALVNLALLVVVNNLLGWGWLPFLTADFGGLLWMIDISLGASTLLNLIYLAYDPAWFKSVTQMGLNLISIWVTAQLYQVFPFDFSAYRFDWAILIRAALILVILATSFATVVELVRFLRSFTVSNRRVVRDV